ncbi:hypothetical protein N2152v2_007651 [Parachlorella kessleri]
MATVACSSRAVVAGCSTKVVAGLRPLPAVFRKPTPNQQFAAVRRSLKAERKATAVQATSAMEVAQVAVDTGLIFGSAAVMVGLTLIGLAVGFVLLRVESLAEEGKI